MDGNNSVAQVKRDLVILKALNDIALKTIASRKNLEHTKNVAVLKSHTTSHDKTDITRTKDHDVLARKMTINVHELLCKTSSEHTSRTRARDLDGCTRTLTAASSNNNRTSNDVLHTLTTDKNTELLITSRKRLHIHNIRRSADANTSLKSLHEEALSILRTSKLLLEVVKTETRVDALVKDTTSRVLTIEHKNVIGTSIASTNTSSKTSWTTTNDSNINDVSLVGDVNRSGNKAIRLLRRLAVKALIIKDLTASTTLADLIKSNLLVLGKHLNDAASAETTLATTHTSTSAELHTIKSASTILNGFLDITLSNKLAAANNATISRVLLHLLVLLFLGHGEKTTRGRNSALPLTSRARHAAKTLLAKDLHKTLSDSRSRGQTRALDTSSVDEALNSSGANDEITSVGSSTKTSEGSDNLTVIDLVAHLANEVEDGAAALRSAGQVIAVLSLNSSRTTHDGLINSGDDENTLRNLGGYRKDNTLGDVAHVLVKKILLTLARLDHEVVKANHLGDLVAEDTSSVDDVLGTNLETLASLHEKTSTISSILKLVDGSNLLLKQELNTIASSNSGKAVHHLIRRNNTSSGGIHTTDQVL